MMSQIPCKQSIRIEMTGWFKHYFPDNLRRNFLFKVCNYTSYQNLQKTSLPNPFAREKAGDCVRSHAQVLDCLCVSRANHCVHFPDYATQRHFTYFTL